MLEVIKAKSVARSVPGEAGVGNAAGATCGGNIPVSDARHGARWFVVDFVSTASRLTEHRCGPQSHRTSDRCLENLCTEAGDAKPPRVQRCQGVPG